ncbi:MAG TPA: GNAT family N-acetyltransferase, partial [Methanocorpusculum sp.]|nr:GNAT family N-acetyltransferase [Methanocorpusculum sp.]
MPLSAIKVKDNSKEYEDFLSLYHIAFPPIEQIPEDYFQASIHTKGASVTAYYAEETFVGFTYTIETEQFLFLYFFAVNPKLRSQGFGSEIIRDHLMKQYPGKPIVLNAEIPDDAAK